MEAELGRMKKAVAASQVREELALAMPFLAERRKLDERLKELRGEKGGRRRRQAAAGTGGDLPAATGRPQGGEACPADEGRHGGEDAGR
jgi:hypothetical protein